MIFKGATMETTMRNMLSGLAAAAVMAAALLMPAGPARAEEPYPWCAIYSGGQDGGGTNCGFVTIAQCRATISGIGGSCIENPAYPGPARQGARYHPRRRD